MRVDAAEATSFAWVPAFEEVMLERMLVAAVVAADLAADLADDLADEAIEDRSRPEIVFRALRTVEELLVLTSFFEPEIRPLTKLAVLVEDFRPLMLLARVTTLAMLLTFVISILPSVLYWVYNERRAAPADVPLLLVRVVVDVWSAGTQAGATLARQGAARMVARAATAKIFNTFII